MPLTCFCCGECGPCTGGVPNFVQVDDIGTYNCSASCNVSGTVIAPWAVASLPNNCNWFYSPIPGCEFVPGGNRLLGIRVIFVHSTGSAYSLQVIVAGINNPGGSTRNWGVNYRLTDIHLHADWPNCKKILDDGIEVPFDLFTGFGGDRCPPLTKPASVWVRSV